MANESRAYTADDGLKILEYLGITNITDRERIEFKEKWHDAYKGHHGDLVQTTIVLYSKVLPFTCGPSERASLMLSQARDSDILERLETTELDKELKKGIPLEDIIKKGPHKFLKIYPTD